MSFYDSLLVKNQHPMTTRAKKHERQEINGDTKEFLKTVVAETKARIRLIKEELRRIENWKPSDVEVESFPDDCCICDMSDEKIKSLEADLRQEQISLLSSQQELKQIEEEEGEESDAKRPRIQDFDEYVALIGYKA
jgi:hypothetical protein